MKKSFISIVGVLLYAWVCSAEIPDTLHLNLQDIKVINFGTAVKSADPSSTCVEIVGLSEKRVKITAKNPGRAYVDYVLANGEKGTITVFVQGAQSPGALGGLREHLVSALEDVIGIDDIRVNSYLDVVEVKGEIGVFADWSEYRQVLSQIEERWPGKVINSVKFKPALAPLEKSLTEVLGANVGIVDASVVAVNEMGNLKIVLGGSAYSEDDIKVAENVISAFLHRMGMGEVTLINNVTKSDAVVEVEFTYFRLADTIDEEIGWDLLNEIQLSATVGADYATGQKPTYTGDLNFNLNRVFSMLEENGLATVARKQTISVENGSEGTASYGGEQIIPVRRGGERGAEATRIPYGFIIKVTPILKGAETVRLTVDIENSSVELYGANGDYSKSSSAAKSILDVPINGMKVLSVNQSQGKNDGESGTPFLRKIPLLKFIFGKETKVVSMTNEGFLVIPRLSGTPDIVNTPSVSARTDEILAKIEKKLSE